MCLHQGHHQGCTHTVWLSGMYCHPLRSPVAPRATSGIAAAVRRRSRLPLLFMVALRHAYLYSTCLFCREVAVCRSCHSSVPCVMCDISSAFGQVATSFTWKGLTPKALFVFVCSFYEWKDLVAFRCFFYIASAFKTLSRSYLPFGNLMSLYNARLAFPALLHVALLQHFKARSGKDCPSWLEALHLTPI